MAVARAAVVLATLCALALTVTADGVGPSTGSFPRLFLRTVSAQNFTASLSEAAPYVMLEFLAPWCPHCRHFVRDMERLGMLGADGSQIHVDRRGHGADAHRVLARAGQTFNNRTSPVRVGSVDCVNDWQVCEVFNIKGYPTLKFGPRGVQALRTAGALPSPTHPDASAALGKGATRVAAPSADGHGRMQMHSPSSIAPRRSH